VELPRLIRNRLEVAVLGASEPLESQIRSQLVDIVRNCQSEAFRSYQSSAPRQISPPDGQAGSSNSTQPLESEPLPLDPPFDISAWFQPPSLIDPSLRIPSNELLESSAAHRTLSFSNFSDSAYDSFGLGFGDGLESFAGLPTDNEDCDPPSTAEDKYPKASESSESPP
jgi:hypothetical protein